MRIGVQSYVLVAQTTKDVLVVARVADKPALEEGNVENGRVEVDELENENFKSQVVIKLGLGSVHFCKYWNKDSVEKAIFIGNHTP